MTGNKQELIRYRIARAYETLEDTQILAEQKRWNSSINRLYYAAYYAVMALLLADNLFPATHNGAKSNFNQYFISTNRIDKSFEKFTPNCLLGDRKAITMIYLILMKKK